MRNRIQQRMEIDLKFGQTIWKLLLMTVWKLFLKNSTDKPNYDALRMVTVFYRIGNRWADRIHINGNTK